MADSLLRVAFMNTSATTTVTVHVVTQDTIEVCELLTTTQATLPEQNPGTTHQAGGFDLVIAPGTIIGFVSKKAVTITNPSSAAVATFYADGKDPWPQPPPPPPPGFANVSDFDIRYNNFLMGGGVPSRKAKLVQMTLAPAPASS